MLWKKCLEIIQDNLTKEQYEMWFTSMDLVSYTDGNLVLSVPSHFVYEFIEAHFVDLLGKTLKHVFGGNVRLSYSILEDKKTGTTITVDSGPEKATPNGPSRERANTSPTPLTAPAVQDLDSQLKLSYNFDNYKEGESNRLARSVGEAIAQKPACTFNPFFVFGPSGVGKTHLVNAIGLRIKELHPEMRVLYVSAHLFMVQWTDAVRHNVRNDFIAFYQTIDVLIIDDIQELSGKTDTQNTFFHIFNHLQLNGKQIILTADRPPVSIVGLEDRLLTRFKWGLQAEIEKPTTSLRYSILSDKIHKEGLSIPENIITYISEHIDESVRDLEGIVNSLMAYSVVYNCDITMKLVNKILPRFVEIDDTPLTIETIKAKVCEHFNVTEEALCSRSRKQPIVYIRQLAIFLSSKYTEKSTIQIGRCIGGRNHATVIHSINHIQNLMDVDEKTRRDINELEGKIRR
ncbi:MAG: chromosomal replication initiator protein DnaA [Bacteroides sp.]|nr:chromosomal replication initiator protein DnaA [Bacteroides sp.]